MLGLLRESDFFQQPEVKRLTRHTCGGIRAWCKVIEIEASLGVSFGLGVSEEVGALSLKPSLSGITLFERAIRAFDVKLLGGGIT